MAVDGETVAGLLTEVLTELKALKQENAHLTSSIDEINGRVNILAGIKQVRAAGGVTSPTLKPAPQTHSQTPLELPKAAENVKEVSEQYQPAPTSVPTPEPAAEKKQSMTSKITLTSYPGQAGVDPCPMEWGHKDPAQRGPVVVSRHPSTIRRRNGTIAPVPLHTM